MKFVRDDKDIALVGTVSQMLLPIFILVISLDSFSICLLINA